MFICCPAAGLPIHKDRRPGMISSFDHRLELADGKTSDQQLSDNS